MVGNFIRDRVEECTGVTLVFEPQFIGDFTPYDRAGFEARYEYTRAPEGEPDWMTALR
jgi:hypothetical protein